MNHSTFSRAWPRVCAAVAAFAITFAMVQSNALLGYPASAAQVVVAQGSSTTTAQ